MAQLTLARRLPVSVLLDKADTDSAALADTGVVTSSADPVPDLDLDFDTANALGLNCGGADPVSSPTLCGLGQGVNVQAAHPVGDYLQATNGIYRKHAYNPTQGRSGSGAISMHWSATMSVGFSPVWTSRSAIPLSRYFRFDYWVRQNAVMVHSGSAVKLNRLRSLGPGGDENLGTLESQNGFFIYFWEGWNSNLPISATPLQMAVPSDDLWHKYTLIHDFRVLSALSFRFLLDDVEAPNSPDVNDSKVGDLMATDTGLFFSPFAEMYSGVFAGTTTGDYVVDDFTYTDLEP